MGAHRVGDALGDPAGVDEHLQAGNAATAHGANQALADDPAQRAGQAEPDLLLLVRGEEVDCSVDRLGGVHRVQRGKHQVTRLRCLQRGPDGLRIPHLSDQDHIGVLAHGISERGEEVWGVEADLSLVDRRHRIGVDDLDGILDRDDVHRPSQVDVADHRGERGGLARAGGTRDQDQPALLVGELAHHVGHLEFLERRPADADLSQHHAHGAALMEDVHAKAPHP